MVLALLWTIVSGCGFFVAVGVLNDTLIHYARFKRERPELVGGYRIEVVTDAAIATVQGGFATLGALALLANGSAANSALARAAGLILFVGPILLMAASIFHYRSRHRL